MANTIRNAAPYYDLITSPGDLDFYLHFAERMGGPILDLGCGTGRLAIPLAQAGHVVWGVDASDEMLAQFEKKMEQLPPDVLSRLHVEKEDLTRLEIPEKFSLAILPYHTFQYLTSKEDQAECLQRIYDQLKPDSLLVLDVFRPPEQLDESWKEDFFPAKEFHDPETGRRVVVKDRRRRIDTDRQIIYPEMVFQITHPGGRKEEVVEPLELAYFYEDQLRDLLELHGFSVLEEWGDYDGTPMGENGELIFVCRLKGWA